MSENQKIAWDNSYSLGIKSIDEQHKKLFEIVNRLYDLEENSNIKEEIRQILYAFKDYTITHFRDEEIFMESIRFPDLMAHKELHKDIIDSLSKIVQTPASLSIIKSKMRIVAKRVLLDHILLEDTKARNFYIKNDMSDEKIFSITDI